MHIAANAAFTSPLAEANNRDHGTGLERVGWETQNHKEKTGEECLTGQPTKLTPTTFSHHLIENVG